MDAVRNDGGQRKELLVGQACDATAHKKRSVVVRRMKRGGVLSKEIIHLFRHSVISDYKLRFMFFVL